MKNFGRTSGIVALIGALGLGMAGCDDFPSVERTEEVRGDVHITLEEEVDRNLINVRSLKDGKGGGHIYAIDGDQDDFYEEIGTHADSAAERALAPYMSQDSILTFHQALQPEYSER